MSNFLEFTWFSKFLWASKLSQKYITDVGLNNPSHINFDVYSRTQGFESPEICLVLVPFFSASPKNVLVLVPHFSALALSTKALILVPISTKTSASVLFSALQINLSKIMVSGNVE